jgi:hypothetical protein
MGGGIKLVSVTQERKLVYECISKWLREPHEKNYILLKIIK